MLEQDTLMKDDFPDYREISERETVARETVSIETIWESIGPDAIPGKVGSRSFLVDYETLAMRILIAINTHDEAELGRLLIPMADKYIQDSAVKMVSKATK